MEKGKTMSEWIVTNMEFEEAYAEMYGYKRLVRCKDCKWWKTNYSWNGKEHKVCVIEPYEPVRKPDDYCSRGERKDDEQV